MATDLPSQSNNIPPAPPSETLGVADSGLSNGPRRYRAITHALVLTTFVLPFLVLPYLLIRRQISSIHRQVDRLTTRVHVLQQDLNSVSSKFAAQKDGHQRLNTLVYNTMRETDELRAHAEQTEKNQAASDECVRSDLQRLIDEMQRTRTQTAALRALGMSLADIAAFMHEIELEMGMNQGTDRRGIEKLRQLALRMEMDTIPQQDKNPSEKLAD